jgi:hypothetical protein
LYLFAVDSGRAERLELPDYIQNALGRVNAVEIDHARVSTAKRWDGDDLVVDLYFTANQRHTYTCEVVLHLTHGGYNAPTVSLKSVSSPIEGGG